MRTATILTAILVLALSMPATAVWARGGPGGGGRAGGGVSGGARSAAGSAFDRSPSMSRSAPSPQRSAQVPANAAARRPEAGRAMDARPNIDSSSRAANAQSFQGRGAFESPRSYQRPSQNQLNSFLDLPQESRATARSSASLPGLSQSNQDATKSKTFTTQGGSTVTIGGGKGSGTTDGGATVGGAGVGIKIEGANGQTYVKGKGVAGASDGDNKAFVAGSRTGVETASGAKAVSGRGVAGATDGTNSAVAGRGFTAAEDAAGNKVVNARGGYANSWGYRQAGGITAAKGQGGYAAVNVRGGYGANGTGHVGSATAIRGPGGNTIAYGRGASFVNGQFVGGDVWRGVNGNFAHWNYYTPAWHAAHPGCWWPGKWAVATTAWAAATWAIAGAYCGCQPAPIYYDYAQDVTCEDGTVYYGDQPIASAEQYYDQAEQIADAGQNAENQDWMPLGIFAVVAPDQTKAEKLLQLAVNKDGVIRGNYQDLASDKIVAVTGSVDRETQRVALRVEGSDSVVAETGLYNLTNDEVPFLVHYGPDRQQPVTLVRLQQPENSSKQ